MITETERSIPRSELQAIARRRRSLGIQQGAFAHMLGLSMGHYRHLEQSQRDMTPMIAARCHIVLAELERAHERARSRSLLIVA